VSRQSAARQRRAARVGSYSNLSLIFADPSTRFTYPPATMVSATMAWRRSPSAQVTIPSKEGHPPANIDHGQQTQPGRQQTGGSPFQSIQHPRAPDGPVSKSPPVTPKKSAQIRKTPSELHKCDTAVRWFVHPRSPLTRKNPEISDCSKPVKALWGPSNGGCRLWRPCRISTNPGWMMVLN
jgi:hypothetical protein